MLVLTRKKGERILIGEDIVITVIETRGDEVRIGIEAPARIKVHRDEVARAVAAANRDAASTDAERLAGLLAPKAAPVAPTEVADPAS
jgi:carbon storage regulator